MLDGASEQCKAMTIQSLTDASNGDKAHEGKTLSRRKVLYGDD